MRGTYGLSVLPTTIRLNGVALLMAYVDQNKGKERTMAAVITAIILAVVGYAFITGLAFNVIKKTAED